MSKAALVYQQDQEIKELKSRISQLESLYAEMTRKRGEALETISQLEQNRVQEIENAYQEGYERGYYEFAVPEWQREKKYLEPPMGKEQYLSQFKEQTKNENI